MSIKVFGVSRSQQATNVANQLNELVVSLTGSGDAMFIDAIKAHRLFYKQLAEEFKKLEEQRKLGRAFVTIRR